MKGQVFQINYENVAIEEEEKYVPQEDEIEAFVKANLEFASDSEDDSSSTPFERIAEKMVNVTDDGKIKKRIKREGTGTTPPDLAVCSILYSSYLEYNDEPTDYAFIKKPYQFRLGTACVNGLNLAVASMKVTEKAQFLIQSDYAFGSMGHPPRIPANATFLFNIELLKFSDSGAALGFEKLTVEDKKQFATAYKTALGLMESAKEHFKHNFKLAIREYNRALGLIEECTLKDIEEQAEQQKLRLRILTNLAVCYNKENLPKKACVACNDIYHLVKNTSLTVPPKVYFHNGRALYMIGDYQRAKERLLKAQRLEPQNTDISAELLKVNEKIQKNKLKEKEVAKKFLTTSYPDAEKPSTSGLQISEITEEDEPYRKIVADFCEQLIKSNEQQYSLPSGLTVKERAIAKMEAENRGLKFRESRNNENNGKLTFYITKMQ